MKLLFFLIFMEKFFIGFAMQIIDLPWVLDLTLNNVARYTILMEPI